MTRIGRTDSRRSRLKALAYRTDGSRSSRGAAARRSSRGSVSDLVSRQPLGDLDRVEDVLLEHGGERLHAFRLAVDQEAAFDVAAALLEPPGQVVLIGVAREAVEDVDGGVQVVPLIED